MGGTAQVLRADALRGGRMVSGTGWGDSDGVTVINTARDEEYGEIIHRCAEFLIKIEQETAAGHFTYAELEENDEDLIKLRTW
jgi:hypothetical protein